MLYRYFACVIALITFSCPARSAQLPVPDDVNFNAVFAPDDNNVWAVGDMGTIRYSSDGGENWTIQYPPRINGIIPPTLIDVFFLDKNTGWIAGEIFGYNGYNSTSVLFFTNNGGQNWTAAASGLPVIKRIKFFNPQQGIFAGNPSEIAPSGVMQTSDGGKTWIPLPLAGDSVSQQWLAADFRSITGYMLLGTDGGFVRLDPYRSEIKSNPMFHPHQFSNIASVGNRVFVLGSNGTILTSESGGGAWQNIDLPVDAHGVDFTAAFGVFKLFAAGSPGNAVFMYDPQINRWKSAPVPIRTPINDFCFINQNKGWAVGAMGNILRTEDSGNSWKSVFSGGKRAAILVFCLDESTIPWEALAQLAVKRGALIVLEVVGSRNNPDSNRAGAGDRLHTAALRCAITQTNLWPGFPLPDSKRVIDDGQTLNLWNQANDAKAGLVLQEKLVLKIRQWQPEAILLTGSDPLKTPQELLNKAVEDAITLANDPLSFSYQITTMRLQNWKTRYCFYVQSELSEGDCKIPITQAAVALFGSLGAAGADARRIIGTDSEIAPTENVVIKINALDSSVQTSKTSDVTSLLRLVPQENQRVNRNFFELDADKLEKQIRVCANLQNLIRNPSGAYLNNPQSLLGYAGRLSNDLDAEIAVPLLEQMSMQYRITNNPNLAAEVDMIIYDSYNSDSAGAAAANRLMAYFSSGEIAISEKNINPFVPHQTEFQFAKNRLQLAGIFAGLVKKRNPMVYQSGQFRRVLASVERRLTLPEAKNWYAQAVSSQSGYDPTSTLNAETEIWIDRQSGYAPIPVVHCIKTDSAPKLDGDLTDSVWQSCKGILVQGDKSVYPYPTEFRFAYDRQFLYTAVRVFKLPGFNYRVFKAPRKWDDDISQSDRIEMRFDTDRDFSTSFQFSADNSGRPNDACGDNTGWNPRWFIAAGNQPTFWTLEIAIPWSEIVSAAPERNSFINVRLFRIVPGKDAQSIQPVNNRKNLDWGLLLLE